MCLAREVASEFMYPGTQVATATVQAGLGTSQAVSRACTVIWYWFHRHAKGKTYRVMVVSLTFVGIMHGGQGTPQMFFRSCLPCFLRQELAK